MNSTLIIASSPRRNGNTDRLAQWAANIVQKKGCKSEIIYLRDLKFSSCIACEACNKDGQCHVMDDLQKIYPKITGSEKIVFAAPIFFQSLGALPKALIDRTQCYWSAHYYLHKKVISNDVLRKKRGLYALLCGATNLQDTFSCAEKTLRIFASTIEAKYAGGSFFPGIDEKGAIEKNHQAKEQLESALELLIPGS
ncbi:MAG: flavodoxin family protein [Dehalobacterium sp.]